MTVTGKGRQLLRMLADVVNTKPVPGDVLTFGTADGTDDGRWYPRQLPEDVDEPAAVAAAVAGSQRSAWIYTESSGVGSCHIPTRTDVQWVAGITPFGGALPADSPFYIDPGDNTKIVLPQYRTVGITVSFDFEVWNSPGADEGVAINWPFISYIWSLTGVMYPWVKVPTTAFSSGSVFWHARGFVSAVVPVYSPSFSISVESQVSSTSTSDAWSIEVGLVDLGPAEH